MVNENPYRAAGTFDGDSYIEREADEVLLEEISKNRAYPYFLAPRQSGKSSLIAHIMKKLDAAKFESVFIDISAFPRESFRSYDVFLRSVISEILLALGMHSMMSGNNNLREVLKFIATNRAKRIIIFLDEIDRLVNAKFKADFLALIRSFFNRRASDKDFERIQFVLSGAAQTTALITEEAGSPFNVGTSIPLRDLPLEQVVKMMERLSDEAPLEIPDIAHEIYKYTGGSVYLTQLVLERLWDIAATEPNSEISLETVDKVITAIIDESPSNAHFLNIYSNIVDKPDIHQAFLRVVAGHSVDKQKSDFLEITGITVSGKYRNLIYERVFRSSGPLSMFDTGKAIDFDSLIVRAQKGDRKAFNELVGFYAKRLWVTIYDMLENEGLRSDRESMNRILQETWIRVYQDLSKFDRQSDFFSWVCEIARNEVRNWVEKRSKDQYLYPPLEDELAQLNVRLDDIDRQSNVGTILQNILRQPRWRWFFLLIIIPTLIGSLASITSLLRPVATPSDDVRGVLESLVTLPFDEYISLDNRLKMLAQERGKTPEQLKDEIDAWIEGVKTPYEKGLAALDRQKYQEAEKYLNESIESSELELAARYFHRGNAHIGSQKYDQAIASFKAALSIDADLAEAHLNLGLAYAKEGKCDLAIASLRKAVTINRNLAIEAFLKAIDINPDFAEAHLNLGLAYAKQGRYDLATKVLQKAIAINPDFAEAHLNLGATYLQQGRYESAITSFKAAVRIDPNSANAHYNLGLAYAERKKYDLAIVSFKTAIRINPNFADAHYDLWLAYAEQKKYDLAIVSFKTAIRIDPKQIRESFKGEDRKKISHEIAKLYDQDKEGVVNALIDNLILEESYWDYRVNLYIAYTLRHIKPNWEGTHSQLETLRDLKTRGNYQRDVTFRENLDTAISNYQPRG